MIGKNESGKAKIGSGEVDPGKVGIADSGLVEVGIAKIGIAVAKHEKILPFRQRAIPQPDLAALDQKPMTDDPFAHAWWRKEHADRRMMEVLDALDQAKRRGVTERQMSALESLYRHEVEVHAAALDALGN